MTPPELAILAALPGSADVVREIRVALLRLLHAGQQAAWAIDSVETDLAGVLENPPWTLSFLVESSADSANRLRALAAEFDKSARFLAALEIAIQKDSELLNAVRRQPDRDPRGPAEPPF